MQDRTLFEQCWVGGFQMAVFELDYQYSITAIEPVK